ncbi:MAG TPA: hypothetical protein ENH91_03500 [Leeuwenhoekiella sp.]|nr:hypothetical protein [Leeuwenhoekiella sp.]
MQLLTKKGQVTQHYCTCHYDHGPVCKHGAAVLFLHGAGCGSR